MAGLLGSTYDDLIFWVPAPLDPSPFVHADIMSIGPCTTPLLFVGSATRAEVQLCHVLGSSACRVPSLIELTREEALSLVEVLRFHGGFFAKFECSFIPLLEVALYFVC